MQILQYHASWFLQTAYLHHKSYAHKSTEILKNDQESIIECIAFETQTAQTANTQIYSISFYTVRKRNIIRNILMNSVAFLFSERAFILKLNSECEINFLFKKNEFPIHHLTIRKKKTSKTAEK